MSLGYFIHAYTFQIVVGLLSICDTVLQSLCTVLFAYLQYSRFCSLRAVLLQTLRNGKGFIATNKRAADAQAIKTRSLLLRHDTEILTEARFLNCWRGLGCWVG